MCHLAIARCEQSVGNTACEAEALVAASRSYLRAERKIKAVCCPSIEDHLTAGRYTRFSVCRHSNCIRGTNTAFLQPSTLTATPSASWMRAGSPRGLPGFPSSLPTRSAIWTRFPKPLHSTRERQISGTKSDEIASALILGCHLVLGSSDISHLGWAIYHYQSHDTRTKINVLVTGLRQYLST